MNDFLDEKRIEIQQRLKELGPLVDEFRRLEEAERALTGVGAKTGSVAIATRSTTRKKGGRPPGRPPGRPSGRPPGRPPGRPRKATTSTRTEAATTTGRRGRPPGSGTRATQALQLVHNNPGISIPDLAERMKIKQNYLYRVMPNLAKQGKIKKTGKGWYAQ